MGGKKGAEVVPGLCMYIQYIHNIGSSGGDMFCIYVYGVV